jgi:hypothetical protein
MGLQALGHQYGFVLFQQLFFQWSGHFFNLLTILKPLIAKKVINAAATLPAPTGLSTVSSTSVGDAIHKGHENHIQTIFDKYKYKSNCSYFY